MGVSTTGADNRGSVGSGRCIQNPNRGRRREHDDVRKRVRSAGAQKKRDTGRRKAQVPRGCVHSGRETGGRMELPYLHGLDGLVGVLHGAEVVVNGLVRQQQLVQDLQRPGPVANRFQRHDRTTSWDCERIRRGSPDTLSPALSHTFLHTHTLALPLSSTTK